MKAYKINVFGRVHGVYFRATTLQKANELGIKGTVKNLPDGSVQIITEGSSDKLELFIKWCHEGPVLAKVTSVEISDTVPVGFTGFEII